MRGLAAVNRGSGGGGGVLGDEVGVIGERDSGEQRVAVDVVGVARGVGVVLVVVEGAENDGLTGGRRVAAGAGAGAGA